jgi:rSAM/selenodomain-associated transferase 1
MTLLGLFAKHWQPGQVKTRLAATIGYEAASRLHRRFVETLVARFRDVADDRVLCFSPPEAGPEFAPLAAGAWRLVPQVSGDLGRRMQAFFEQAFSFGARKVLLIGSDSPSLPAQYLDQAFDVLTERDVVLGPATDGGYYLLGARDRPPPVFEGIFWSTDRVWAQTVSRLDAAGLAWTPLSPWYDVDTVEDLARLRDELAASDPADEPLARLRQDVNLNLPRQGGPQASIGR